MNEQQRFLRLVLKTGEWQSGRLRTEFEEPFESLCRSNRLSRTKHMTVAPRQAGFQDWLPGTFVRPAWSMCAAWGATPSTSNLLGYG